MRQTLENDSRRREITYESWKCGGGLWESGRDHSMGWGVAHAPAQPPRRPCVRVHEGSKRKWRRGAAGPRVRAASGSGCESGSGRLEPGAGRGPGLSVRRQRRRRRLGRRVQASGARSVGWVGVSTVSACEGERSRLPLSPPPLSLSPLP